ncbi:MAG: hypothetical protein QCI00_05720 [Candidatus Thermoplasmatota archaeon]|nr:hypothetical protein [Candidatus Thermoplasmatota archaeon]
MNRILNKISIKIDIFLVVTAIIISSIIILLNHLILNQNILFELSATILLTSIAYIFFRNRLKKNLDIANPELSKNIKKILNVVFFVLVIMINFIYHSSLYRPQLYYILLVICIGLITLDILMIQKDRQIGLVLFKILCVSFILRAGLFYEYPGFYGADPWMHMFWVQIMEEIGSLPFGLSEFSIGNYPPVFHLEVLTSVLVSGMGLKNSFFLSWGIIYSIGILFIYLFSRELFNAQIALLASVFITINQFHIAWGAWLIPTSIGVVIFSLFLYLIHKKGNQKQIATILIMCSLMLIFLHTLSPVVIVLAISIYGLSVYLSSYFIKGNIEILNYRSAIFLSLSLAVIALLRFIYMSYSKGGATFIESVLYPLKRTIETEMEFKGGEFVNHTFSDYPLNRVSFMLIIAFTLFGVFLCLKKEYQSRERFGLICVLTGLIFFSYGPSLLNVGNFIPGRWLVFGMVVGAPIAAIGIKNIFYISNKAIYNFFICICIMMIVTFFCINTQSVNMRTPFYGELAEDPQRSALLHSEICAVSKITDIYVGNIEASGKIHEYYFYNIDYSIDKMKNPSSRMDQDTTLSITRLIDLKYRMKNNEKSILKERDDNNLIYNNYDVWAVMSEE